MYIAVAMGGLKVSYVLSPNGNLKEFVVMGKRMIKSSLVLRDAEEWRESRKGTGESRLGDLSILLLIVQVT